MKETKLLLLSFIFFAFYIYKSSGQNLKLIINSDSNFEQTIIDSLNYQKSFTNYKSLNEEINRFDNKLQSIGYIESEIISTNKTNDSTYVSYIRLNKKYNTIYIYYNKNEISSDIIQVFDKNVTPEYFISSIKESERILNAINTLNTQNGQPFASLKLNNIKKRDSNSLQGELILTTNKKRHIDKITIKGYKKFPRSFLKHFLKIKENTVFNLDEIKTKTHALNSLPFSKQTKSPEVLFTKDSTSLYLYLEKTTSNNFDGFLGFGTNETTNKIEFDGYLNLNLTNNLNYGESFRLLYKSDENDQKTFQADLNLPYLFNSPIGTELSLNIFKKDSTFTTTNQSVNLFYQLNDKSKIFAGITSTQSNNLQNSTDTTNLIDYYSSFYNVGYRHQRAQYLNTLFPTNFTLDIVTGFGSRKATNYNENQIVFNLNTSKIFNFNSKNSFYMKFNSNGIISDTHLENELLRFGGINSIRGFEENSLTASLFSVLNSEYRYQLNSSIYIHSIIDAAYLENTLINSKQKLFGFGFGFGLLTNAGLLKFNYANGKSENQKFKLSNSKIHISLSAKF